MSASPVLVLQMRRLGDLILTFPLLRSLRTRFPGHPLWIVGRPEFFKPLQPFAPGIDFFAPEQLGSLVKHSYRAILNLDISPQTASFAGQAKSGLKLGPLQTRSGLRVAGFWQLYRTALTHNNRHNLFHWADLNRLDLGFPLDHGDIVEPKPKGAGRIGLFVGASETIKRPEEQFWVALAARLARNGYKPVILGGPAEQELGAFIASRAKLEKANFCGRLNLSELAALLQSLDLLLSPDTGPMHLADWLGTPVLNLSMGSVQAAETGPFRPGQWVCRANISCYGCWQCKARQPFCKRAFRPQAVDALAAQLLDGAVNPNFPGLELLKTGRDGYGLYQLTNLSRSLTSRDYISRFWQAAFLSFNKLLPDIAVEKAAAALCRCYPKLAAHMRISLGKMITALALASRSDRILPEDFWKKQPAHCRIFAGFTQMSMQNQDYSRAAREDALARLDGLQRQFAAL